MSSTLFHGGRIVESRHCRELAKILASERDRWNEFRSALGVPLNLVEDYQIRLKNDERSVTESAYYQVIYLWMSRSRKNATFGALIDVMARQLELMDAANKVMEKQWV